MTNTERLENQIRTAVRAAKASGTPRAREIAARMIDEAFEAFKITTLESREMQHIMLGEWA